MKLSNTCSVLFLFAGFVICAYVSCSSPVTGEGDTVRYVAPDTEKLVISADECKKAHTGEDFFIVWSSCPGESLTFAWPKSAGQNFSVLIKKNAVTAVLAYPESGGKPWGAIYPYSQSLSKIDGFAANILYEMYNSTDVQNDETIASNMMLFNWQKMMEGCQGFEDPWKLDEDKIKKAVKSGKFKKSDLKVKK